MDTPNVSPLATAIHGAGLRGFGDRRRTNSINRMKILVFTSLYPNNIWPNHGIFIKERMSQFAKLDGCEVKVVAPVPYFPAVKVNWRWRFSQVVCKEIRDGIEVYHPQYFITPKVGMAFYGWMMFLSALPVVKTIQKEFNFDLIDAHYVYPDGFAAIQLGRFFRRPVVVSARGSDINVFKTFPLIRKLLQYVLQRADRVVAVSQPLKEAMVQLGIPEEKICGIPNGVDPEKFYSIPKEQARRELGLPNRRMILSVGNLTSNKGFDLLVRALRILVDEFHEQDLQLVIIGEGFHRSQLEKTISLLNLGDRIRMPGTVPHEKLGYWYSAADVFCLASKQEGWPNVILEALACGTPVVGAAVGGIPEIIVNEDIGLLTGHTPAVMAARLREAMQKNWDRDRIVRYAGDFTWNEAAAKVHQVFDSVLSRSRRGSCASMPEQGIV
jgi:teichuronic acid biosynthesis glycosyltransferase TuaC